MKNTLLLTAAIKPPFLIEGKPESAINSITRNKEYIKALVYYIAQPGFENIVFCENTGYNLAEYEELIDLANGHGKNLEVLSFKGDINLIKKFNYYGCGEAEILDYAFKKSSLINQTESFYKITGRYILKNPGKVVNSIGVSENYFRQDGLYPLNHFFDNMFDVMTAFFKVSNIFYEKNIYGKIIPIYEELYKNNNINELFPEKYKFVLLETVFYILLRDKLKDLNTGKFINIEFEHNNKKTFQEFLNKLIYLITGLDRFNNIHLLLDRILYKQKIGRFLNGN